MRLIMVLLVSSVELRTMDERIRVIFSQVRHFVISLCYWRLYIDEFISASASFSRRFSNLYNLFIFTNMYMNTYMSICIYERICVLFSQVLTCVLFYTHIWR